MRIPVFDSMLRLRLEPAFTMGDDLVMYRGTRALRVVDDQPADGICCACGRQLECVTMARKADVCVWRPSCRDCGVMSDSEILELGDVLEWGDDAPSRHEGAELTVCESRTTLAEVIRTLAETLGPVEELGDDLTLREIWTATLRRYMLEQKYYARWRGIHRARKRTALGAVLAPHGLEDLVPRILP